MTHKTFFGFEDIIVKKQHSDGHRSRSCGTSHYFFSSRNSCINQHDIKYIAKHYSLPAITNRAIFFTINLSLSRTLDVCSMQTYICLWHMLYIFTIYLYSIYTLVDVNNGILDARFYFYTKLIVNCIFARHTYTRIKNRKIDEV